MRKFAVFALAAADREREREAAAKGPAAVEAALAGEYAAAVKAGDKEHEASIKQHLANYLDEVHGGGRIREREAAAQGPAAVKAALAGEMAEAEKFHDTEHENSIKQHEADYLDEVNGGGKRRQAVANAEGPAAERAALEGEYREAAKFGDTEHERSIEAHYAHYLEAIDRPWDYSHDERRAELEALAAHHRVDIDSTQAAEESAREHRLAHTEAQRIEADCHMPSAAANALHHARGCRSDFDYVQWSAVYNALSFGIAAMGSAMIYVWLMIANVAKPFKSALAVNGLVTGIATYHYFRIFNSWCDSFHVFWDDRLERFVVNSSGEPFNDAYRYVDWLLTVPLLLIELILVMQLPAGESGRKMWTLGVSSALMVAGGYPGEVRDDPGARWFYWGCSMCPFTYVLYELYFGLAEATQKNPPAVASVIASARYLTAISWLTYPFVYMVKGVGLRGGLSTALEQIGYSVADVVAKAVFGIMIWRIADAKTTMMEENALLK